MAPRPLAPPVLPFALPDCIVGDVRAVGVMLLIEAHTTLPCQRCPACDQPSARVHSRYLRLVRDLPVSDRPTRLLLRVRRFFCDAPACPKRTFAERLPDLAPLRARRTPRLTHSLRDIGFANGGEAGARLAVRLRMRTSGDTLLRILRATPPPDAPPPTVIGIDDFALRKGRAYGTIVVDLERCRPIDLLPDRTAETVAARLRASPDLAVIARDRAKDYARGATAGAPQATQVADRFHILCNLREAVERYLTHARPALRLLLDDDASNESREVPTPVADGPPPPRDDGEPGQQSLQAVRHTERDRRFRQVKEAQGRGLNLRQLARECGLSIKTVRLWAGTDTLPPDQRSYRRGGKVEPYAPYLYERLAAGCTNQSRLWRDIRAQGFTGTCSLVAKWVHAHRHDVPVMSRTATPTLPGPTQFAWLVLRADDEEALSKEDGALWERLRRHEELVWVQDMARRFAALMRERRVDELDPWLAECRAGPVLALRNFGAGLEQEGDAIRAAVTLPWSTGPVEGHINKLKLIKRSAYGRMKLDLLRQRVLHAA